MTNDAVTTRGLTHVCDRAVVRTVQGTMLVDLAVLFTLHFIADFPLQSRDMAREKSTKLKVLIDHVWVHLLVFSTAGWFLLPYMTGLVLAAVVAIVHGVIDWYIWRGYKWYRMRGLRHADSAASFRWWEDGLFFTVIGFDQLLHGLTIIVAYYFVVL